MRELKVNLKDLADAFDNGFDEITYYLDLETGEVVMVTEESRHLLTELSEVEQAETLEAALEAIRSADIPQREMDMEAFVETTADASVQESLEAAIQGKGAFARIRQGSTLLTSWDWQASAAPCRHSMRGIMPCGQGAWYVGVFWAFFRSANAPHSPVSTS